MQLTIPQKLIDLAHAAPFPLYLVGGAVRDALAGLTCSQDWDICAPCDAERFSKLAADNGFTVNGTYKNTGTVNLSDGEHKFEFTSFRTDVYRRGEHAPEKIVFTDDIETDARRRDFKCNAVYYDLRSEKIEDPLGGVSDIENRCISTTARQMKFFPKTDCGSCGWRGFRRSWGLRPILNVYSGPNSTRRSLQRFLRNGFLRNCSSSCTQTKNTDENTRITKG